MYLNTATQTQHSESDIRALNPNTSFPVPFTPPEVYALIFPSPQPTHNTVTQRVQGVMPVLTAKGTLEQQWQVVPRFVEYTDAAAVLHTVAAQETQAITVDKASKIAVKSEAIKAERDQRKSGGVLVSGKWFHTDSDSRIQQLGLVMMGANVPAVQWKTMDGSFTPMSQTLASAVFQAVAGLDMGLFAQAETHANAMKASAAPETYDVTTGWPASFVVV